MNLLHNNIFSSQLNFIYGIIVLQFPSVGENHPVDFLKDLPHCHAISYFILLLITIVHGMSGFNRRTTFIMKAGFLPINVNLK